MINPNDNNEIQNLNTEEIAFPEIEYAGLPPLDLDRTTLHQAYSIIANAVDPQYLNDLNWIHNADIQWQLNELQLIANNISQMILNYRNHPNVFLLTKIFIWIQLWGGVGGRSIFIRGLRWPNNFDVNIYSAAVASTTNEEFNEALFTLNQLYGVNTAFATKHIHFWSNGNAPIFDSIISKIIFGIKEPNPNNYNDYILGIDEVINILALRGTPNITREMIERNLFNWANTLQGKNWIQIRIGI